MTGTSGDSVRMDDVERLLERVLALPECERPDYLERECAGNSSLLVEVESLARAAESAGEFLQGSRESRSCARKRLSELLQRIEPPSVGTRLGDYELIEEFGRGGCGVVYRARQIDPPREVALKVLRPTGPFQADLERFRFELRILARMDHPSIARLLEAGRGPQGQLYIAMELIRGDSIVSYCDAKRLTVDERLRLLVLVCNAVTSAHEKQVIHLDIKPSNVLVTEYDGAAVPKVIDFGIAHVLAEAESEGQGVHGGGTPAYMSPEQAQRVRGSVGPVADVYGLGGLLYSLLVGTPPRRHELPHPVNGPSQLSRFGPLVPPSRAADGSDPNAHTVAANRRLGIVDLERVLRGDLDAIAEKALRIDPADRYASARALGADLERYLGNLPTSVGSRHWLYRLRLFTRRRRSAIAVASVVLLLLSMGIVGTAMGFFEAHRSNTRESQAKERIRWSTARAENDERQKLAAAKIAREMTQVPRRSERDYDVIRHSFENELGKQGAQEALQRLASGLWDDGRTDEAVSALQSLYYSERDATGDCSERTLFVAVQLGSALLSDGRTTDAVEFLEGAYDAALAAQGWTTEGMLQVLEMLAPAYHAVGEHAAAVDTMRGIHERRREDASPFDPEVMFCRLQLGVSLGLAGLHDESLGELEATVDEYTESLGPFDRRTCFAESALALQRARMGDLNGGIELARRIGAREVANFGERAPEALDTKFLLSCLLRDSGEVEESLELLKEVCLARQQTLPQGHRQMRMCFQSWGEYLHTLGRAAEAVQVWEVLLRQQDDIPEAPALDRAYWLALEGSDLVTLGAFDRAEPLLAESLVIREAYVPDGWITANSRALLGRALLGQGKLEQASLLLGSGCEAIFARLPTIPVSAHSGICCSMSDYARLCDHNKRTDEADLWRDRIRRLCARAEGPR